MTETTATKVAKKAATAKAEKTAEPSVFATLYGVDVSGRLDKKPTGYGNNAATLSYLSWPWAWAEVKKRYRDVSYRIIEFDERGVETEHGYPFQVIGSAGYMVHTEVTIDGESYRMWLPVMDSHNQPVKKEGYSVQTRYSSYEVPPFDTMLLNKAIMRCLVKNLAMFGLGLTVYAGEDTPDVEAFAPAVQPNNGYAPYAPPAEVQNAPMQAAPVQATPAEPAPVPVNAPDAPIEDDDPEFVENPEPEPDQPVDPDVLTGAMMTTAMVGSQEIVLGDLVRKSKDSAKSQAILVRIAADTRTGTEATRSAATLILKALNANQLSYPASAAHN